MNWATVKSGLWLPRRPLWSLMVKYGYNASTGKHRLTSAGKLAIGRAAPAANGCSSGFGPCGWQIDLSTQPFAGNTCSAAECNDIWDGSFYCGYVDGAPTPRYLYDDTVSCDGGTIDRYIEVYVEWIDNPDPTPDQTRLRVLLGLDDNAGNAEEAVYLYTGPVSGVLNCNNITNQTCTYDSVGGSGTVNCDVAGGYDDLVVKATVSG